MDGKLRELLDRRYPSNEYRIVEEVRDKAGHSASRSADAMVVNLWPSRGLSITGIEVKISRSDWLRELKKPEKAEALFKYCDYWYLYVSDESIVKMEEVPEAWGVIAVKGNRIITLKDAPKLTPIPIDRNVFVSILKRGTEGMIALSSIKDKLEQQFQFGRDESKDEIEKLTKELNAIKVAVAEFEKESGVCIYQPWWRHDGIKIGKAVNLVLNGGVRQMEERLEQLKDTSLDIYTLIEKKLSEVKDSNKIPVNETKV